MRYKFRGKRIHDNEWVYGFLVREDHYTGFESESWIIMSLDYDSDVHPETVGQFTGIVVNKKDVYENDIVSTKNYGNLVVKYLPERGAYELNRNDVSIFSRDEIVEVIGNIHDNPELI